MAKLPTSEVVKSFIVQVCAVDLASVHSDSRLLGFGVDSVRLLDLLLAIEDRFGLELSESDPELATVETVGDLAALIERRRAGAT